jgi:alkylation response protein AidB-like acyl-CoA dehydrogenase
MNFDLTDEQKRIRDMAREFANKVIAPRAEEMERSGEYPYDIIEKMGKLGIMGIPFPEAYGGRGGDWVGMHLCIEEISRADVALGGLLDVTTSVVGQEFYVFGTEEQKRKWLVPIAQGKQIGAFGLTESDAGSDPASLRTTAILNANRWVLNGTKQFITNIGLENASVVLVTAITERRKEGNNIISTFIVPKDAPGFQLGKRYEKMAWKASATHEVILEDCQIPEENLLGDPKHGFSQHLAVLETGRISIAAMATGLAQACLDEALAHTRQRCQSPRSLLKSQSTPFRIADIATMIELSRTMYLKAAWLKDQGRKHTLEAHFAKLFASESATKIASEVLKMQGLFGCLDEYPISRYFKMAKLLDIVEGTSEIQRMVIARELLM